MYSILKATFWISLFWVLKNNARQLGFLFLWVLGFFLTDYFFSGFKEITNDEHWVLMAFMAKVLVQLLFVLLLLFGVRKLLRERKQMGTEMGERETTAPLCAQSNPLKHSQTRVQGKTKKQRIIEKYKPNHHCVQTTEESNHE